MARTPRRAGGLASEPRPSGPAGASARPAAGSGLAHALAAGAVVLATLCAAPPAAAADVGWFATFTPEAVEPLFDGAEVSVAVCTVGPDDADARDARAALEAALRIGARTRLIAPGRALSARADEADDEIAARCARPPVTVVAILRMAATDVSEVVDETDPDASALTFHHARRGVMAAAVVRRGAEVRLEGFTPALDPTVVANAGDPVATLNAREAYRRSFVWLEDPRAAREEARRPVAFRGTQREPLEGGDFYEAIGRHDLARSYRQARAMQIGVGALGLVAAAAGVYLMFEDDPDLPIRDAGPSLAVCGVALALAPLDTDGAHPVSVTAARGLADDYNTNLMAQLGLSQRRVTEAGDAEDEAPGATPDDPRLQAADRPDPEPDVRVRLGIGGVGVMGRF